MKTFINIFTLFGVFIMNAQILDIEEVSHLPITNPNIYWRDNNLILNEFEGIYLYNNDNIQLELHLEKKENVFYIDSHYDLMVGEYKLTNSNQEIYNSLNNINVDYVDKIMHSIHGFIIINGPELYYCDNCSANEKRLVLTFDDKIKNIHGYCIIQKVSINNQIGIKVFITYYGNAINTTVFSNPPSVPTGTYYLLKQ
jgi:hypothetical protein